jgi:hypothetical protein
VTTAVTSAPVTGAVTGVPPPRQPHLPWYIQRAETVLTVMSSSSSSVYPSPSTRTCPAVYLHKHIARARIHSMEATARTTDSAVPRARQGRRAGRAVRNAVPRARQCPASCTHDGSQGDQRQQREDVPTLSASGGAGMLSRKALLQPPLASRHPGLGYRVLARNCLALVRIYVALALNILSNLCRAGPQYLVEFMSRWPSISCRIYVALALNILRRY